MPYDKGGLLMSVIFGFDAYSPKEISARVEDVGVVKAGLPVTSLVALGILAGGFIGLGALYYTIVVADSMLGFAATRVLGGITFSLGLILVVVAGAELFTGNNLIVMAWADKKITLAALLRNWLIVYLANFIGAVGLAVLVYLSMHWEMNSDAIGLVTIKIAAYKTSLPFWKAFFNGILCNILVCLAVWLALAGRSVADKILAIIFPISAFVAAGFEHCIANMYFIVLGVLLKSGLSAEHITGIANVNLIGLLRNLIPVSLGNIFGGSVMVAAVYYFVYGSLYPAKKD
jgi:formate/nitrite transporter